MIIVTCQYLDNASGSAANYNGGYAIQLYNVNEALQFAKAESQLYNGINMTASWLRVYNNGVQIAQFLDGTQVE